MAQQRDDMGKDRQTSSNRGRSSVSELTKVDFADRMPIDVRGLLNGAREAILVLDGEAYRLRITAKEKLILTK